MQTWLLPSLAPQVQPRDFEKEVLISFGHCLLDKWLCRLVPLEKQENSFQEALILGNSDLRRVPFVTFAMQQEAVLLEGLRLVPGVLARLQMKNCAQKHTYF